MRLNEKRKRKWWFCLKAKFAWHRCIRTILGLDLGDRVSNQRVLQLSGQPPLENIMRRSRLSWCGHVNRMKGGDGDASRTKRMMFSYLPDDKRPSNIVIRKRWEAKIMEDLAKCDIRNWRSETRDRDKWRALINRRVQSHSVQENIKEVIHALKISADKRRTEEAVKARGSEPRKVMEILVRSTNGSYACPQCQKSCTPSWCKKNKIKIAAKCENKS